MTKLRAHLSKFLSDETGTTAIEYGIIASLLSVVIVGSVTVIGADVLAMFQRVLNALLSL